MTGLTKKKIGVLRFPGTNCDRDVTHMVSARGHEPEFLWHQNRFNSADYQALIVPGGFSFGDYLRSGALAALSPAMESVREFAEKGGPVLGICNGFQILTEARLLPGALSRNAGRRFVDRWVTLKLENANPFFAVEKKTGSVMHLPVAHGDGRYFVAENEAKSLEDRGQIWLRYHPEADGDSSFNPNGSLYNIAGVMNEKKNVVALMPHPERALYDWMGGNDGWGFL